MDIRDRQERKCLLLRAYINGGITISGVASEFPEVEKEVREILSKKYSIPMPAPKGEKAEVRNLSQNSS